MKPSSPITTGIVGMGTIGLRHCEHLPRALFQVVAGVRPSGTRSQHEDFCIPIFSELESLYATGTQVASPNFAHFEHVMIGLQHGCNVLCEKPLGVNEQQVLRVLDFSTESPGSLMTAMNLRFTPGFRTALSHITKGGIGIPLHAAASWVRRRGIPGPGKWNTSKSSAGGEAVLDIGTHVLDAAWLLLGRPTPISVSASTNSLFAGRIDQYSAKKIWNGPVNPVGEYSVEDGCVAFIRFREGGTLTLDVSWVCNGPEVPCQVLVRGEKCGIHWEKGGAVSRYTDEMSPVILPHECGEDMYGCFARLISGGKNCCPPEDSLVLAKIIDAIYLSASEGREIVLA